MQSMTGYGRGHLEEDGRQLTIELKSVNHRYLDLSFRMPRTFGFLEDDLRKRISARLARGHVDVFVNYRNTRDDVKQVTVDAALLGAYLEALYDIVDNERVSDDITVMKVTQLPGVLTVAETEEDAEVLRGLVLRTLDEALDALVLMRTAEGEALSSDMLGRIGVLFQMNRQVAERYPQTVQEYRQKLEARMAELLEGRVEEARLLQEVALMADRSAVAEEVVRLESHFAQVREVIAQPGAVGRKLDFIVQELNREFNTISSKSQDIELTQIVVNAKAEIEKLREQVQNIE